MPNWLINEVRRLAYRDYEAFIFLLLKTSFLLPFSSPSLPRPSHTFCIHGTDLLFLIWPYINADGLLLPSNTHAWVAQSVERVTLTNFPIGKSSRSSQGRGFEPRLGLNTRVSRLGVLIFCSCYLGVMEDHQEFSAERWGTVAHNLRGNVHMFWLRSSIGISTTPLLPSFAHICCKTSSHQRDISLSKYT